jgi:predicted RNase H-like HicB family nuclease
MNVEYSIHTWREGKHSIAQGSLLDVVSSGLTAEEARKALREAVHLFLETAEDSGTLEEVLAECGYEFDGTNWHSPSWISIERHSTEIGARQ